MITEEQRKARMLGIGGSDIPIILGLSQYKTPYQLFLEKRGFLKDTEMTPLQYWGNRLEPLLREEFILRNQVEVVTPETITHPMMDYMRGNIDGYIPEWDAVLEIKTATQWMAQEWGEDGSDIIPLAYLTQVAHYCCVTNSKCAYIAVLIGGYDYRQYKYTRDNEVEKFIVDAAAKFWECVKNNIEPELINRNDLMLKFPTNKKGSIKSVKSELINDLEKLKLLHNKIKELEKLEEESRFKIMHYMEDAECLVNDEGKRLATWKCNKNGSRKFLLKGISNG